MFPYAGTPVRSIPVPEGETTESYLATLRANPDKLLDVLKEHIHGWTDLMVAHALQGARQDNIPAVTEFLEQHIKIRDQAALARAEHTRTRLLMEEAERRKRVEAIIAKDDGVKPPKPTAEERAAQRAASLAIPRGPEVWVVTYYKKSGIYRPQKLVIGPNGGCGRGLPREVFPLKEYAETSAKRQTIANRNYHAKQSRYHAREARRLSKFLKTPPRHP